MRSAEAAAIEGDTFRAFDYWTGSHLYPGNILEAMMLGAGLVESGLKLASVELSSYELLRAEAKMGLNTSRQDIVTLLRNRTLGMDAARGGAYRAREEAAARVIEQQTGRRLTRFEGKEGPDWIDDLGKRWDVVETGPSAHVELDSVISQIVSHTQKADFVPVLIDQLSREQLQTLMQRLGSLVGQRVPLPKREVSVEVTAEMMAKVRFMVLW
jgi:hypothetical protein